MKKIIITACLLALFATAFSQQASNTESTQNFKHAINMCPGGIFFGVYSINYEYLFKPHHGLAARFDYEAIPKTLTEANIESSGWDFVLNYRYHFSGEMESFFVGAYARYKYYSGDGVLDAQDFDFNLKHYTLGLNAGKRWVWDFGLNATIQFGYGVEFKNRTATPTNASIESVIDSFEKKHDFINPFFGEVSIGWAF